MGAELTRTLHLGVLDIPYTDADEGPRPLPKARKGKQRPRGKASSGARTTGDVAEILEAKYHVMETFYDLHEEEIVGDLLDSMEGALESLLMGGPAHGDPLAAATTQIEARFKVYLDSEEIAETATPGVPTKAALRGVNHRLKVKRGERRPSFIDTGQYEASMKAWVD